MDGRRNRKKAYIALLVFFLFPAVVRASELGDFLWKTFNFAVLVGVLVYFAGGSLRKMVSSYSSKIKTELEESERRAREAEEKLKEIEERWRKLDEEVESIRRSAIENASEERERILREAEVEAEKIKRAAMEEMEAMYEKALRELREYAANIAVSIAEERIKKKMTPKIHKKLLEKYIKELRN